MARMRATITEDFMSPGVERNDNSEKNRGVLSIFMWGVTLFGWFLVLLSKIPGLSSAKDEVSRADRPWLKPLGEVAQPEPILVDNVMPRPTIVTGP